MRLIAKEFRCGPTNQAVVRADVVLTSDLQVDHAFLDVGSGRKQCTGLLTEADPMSISVLEACTSRIGRRKQDSSYSSLIS